MSCTNYMVTRILPSAIRLVNAQDKVDPYPPPPPPLEIAWELED